MKRVVAFTVIGAIALLDLVIAQGDESSARFYSSRYVASLTIFILFA